MYCPLRLKCVFLDFHVFNNWYWFHFHKTSFVLDPDGTLHACVMLIEEIFDHFLLKLDNLNNKCLNV